MTEKNINDRQTDNESDKYTEEARYVINNIWTKYIYDVWYRIILTYWWKKKVKHISLSFFVSISSTPTFQWAWSINLKTDVDKLSLGEQLLTVIFSLASCNASVKHQTFSINSKAIQTMQFIFNEPLRCFPISLFQ